MSGSSSGPTLRPGFEIYEQQGVRKRWRLRLLCVGLTVLGLCALGYGAAVSRAVDVPAPVPLGFGGAAVPSAPRFGGSITVYGVPAGGVRPKPADLGCTVSSAEGSSDAALAQDPALTRDRRVVNGVALLPLLDVDGSAAGGRLSCDGTAAPSAAPLYVVVAQGDAPMVPMAAYSLAALSLALGVGGIVSLRRQD